MARTGVRQTVPMPHSRHIQLTFPEGVVTTPVIYEIVKRFDVVPNIRRANIANHVGWMVLDIGGDEAAVHEAIEYLASVGVDVSDADGDILAG